MGMSTHIKAFIPDTDPEYQKHREILLFCHKQEVSLPKETSDYFGILFPQPYILYDILEKELQAGFHYTDWHDESSKGFEVDLTKLPAGVTKLRFYNNW